MLYSLCMIYSSCFLLDCKGLRLLLGLPYPSCHVHAFVQDIKILYNISNSLHDEPPPCQQSTVMRLFVSECFWFICRGYKTANDWYLQSNEAVVALLSQCESCNFRGPWASCWDPWRTFWRHLRGPGLSLGSHGSFLVTGLNLSNFLHRIRVHFWDSLNMRLAFRVLTSI